MTNDSEGRSRAYYDDFATGYERERHHGYHALLDELELGVALPLAEGRDVLEVGCGTGLILGRLSAVARNAEGVDLSPGMLEKARARGLRVREASATELPYPDASFDLVLSFKVLAHVPDLPRALSEMARVCRPGGRVLAELYNPWSLRYLAKRLAGPGKISDGRTEADVYTRWDPPTKLRALLPPALELEEVRGLRVLTPAAFVHKLPLVGSALARAEHVVTRSPLRWFGGFLVVVATKRG
ncbi:MAG TPA: methyltransferase domain-containing protein [Polyangiaceae bacterium]|nr:methyltransferase domain-containing protein [Polyangiaceae bacterium]